jgi:ribosomal protein S18 acetylase RimI-like enzyme
MIRPRMALKIRDYKPEDEEDWLRCRVLSFLHSAYYDDVVPKHPPPTLPGFGLVAEESGTLVGVLDVSVEGELATIDTIAVHPDAQRLGIGTAVFAAGRLRAVAAGATTIEAYTRDDEQALGWYRAQHFEESEHYLHVYASLYADPAEPKRAIESARLGLDPVIVFSHHALDREAELRQQFRRVHVCRRFSRRL